MTVSPELTRVYTSAPSGEIIIETLEISHPNFSQIYYITNCGKDVTAQDEATNSRLFQYFPFSIVLPASSDNGFEDLSITMSNVTRIFVYELERASENVKEPIKFIYRAYASSQLLVPGFVLPELSSTEVVVSEQTVTARASFIDLVNRNFPNQVYTPKQFPMLGFLI